MGRREKALLALCCFSGVLCRELPAVRFGLPYSFDPWEAATHVRIAAELGRFVKTPQGPLFYCLMLSAKHLLSVDVVVVFTYLTPLFSFACIPSVFCITKRVFSSEVAGLYAAALAAFAGILVHQTSIAVPESLGLVQASMALLALSVAIRRWSPRAFSLFALFWLFTLLSHHLTFSLMLLGAWIFCAGALYHGAGGKAVRAVLALSAVTAAVGLLVWLLLIPEYTYGFLWLVLQYTGVFRLAISALLSATFAALALLLVKHLRPEDLERYKAAPLLASLVLFLIFSSIMMVAVPAVSRIPISADLLIFHLTPTVLLVVFPATIGLLSPSSLREWVPKLFPLSWSLSPICAAIALVLSPWLVVSYRFSTLLLVSALPYAGVGYQRLMTGLKPKYRVVAAVYLAYAVLAMVYLAYPPPEQILGYNEAYFPPEIHSCAWAMARCSPSYSFDSDHRLGVALRYYTKRWVWLGNETSWLGVVSQRGEVVPLYQEIGYVVVSESMTKYVVLGSILRYDKPLPPEALDFLNSNFVVLKLYDSREAQVFFNSRAAPVGEPLPYIRGLETYGPSGE